MSRIHIKKAVANAEDAEIVLEHHVRDGRKTQPLFQQSEITLLVYYRVVYNIINVSCPMHSRSFVRNSEPRCQSNLSSSD